MAENVIRVNFKTKKIRPFDYLWDKVALFYSSGLANDLSLPAGKDCYSHEEIKRYLEVKRPELLNPVESFDRKKMKAHIYKCDRCLAIIIKTECGSSK